MSSFQKMCDALHRRPINPQAILDATTVPAKDEWSEEARKAAAEARKRGGGRTDVQAEQRAKQAAHNQKVENAQQKVINARKSTHTMGGFGEKKEEYSNGGFGSTIRKYDGDEPPPSEK